jgi:hypothetical protein
VRTIGKLLPVLLALGLAPATAAAVFTVTLNTASPVTPPGATLSGVDQTKTFTLSITVANATTAGWAVTAAAGVPTVGGKTLPALKVTAVSAAACTGTKCANASNTVTWPVDLTTGGVKIFNAAINTGTGSIVLTPTVQITYPANALPGVYTTTLTVTGTNNGP